MMLDGDGGNLMMDGWARPVKNGKWHQVVGTDMGGFRLACDSSTVVFTHEIVDYRAYPSPHEQCKHVPCRRPVGP